MYYSFHMRYVVASGADLCAAEALVFTRVRAESFPRFPYELVRMGVRGRAAAVSDIAIVWFHSDIKLHRRA